MINLFLFISLVLFYHLVKLVDVLERNLSLLRLESLWLARIRLPANPVINLKGRRDRLTVLVSVDLLVNGVRRKDTEAKKTFFFL